MVLLCAVCLAPGLAAAQSSGAPSAPSGGAMGAAGTTSLGTTMSVTGAGTPPGPTGQPSQKDNMPTQPGNGGQTNTPANAGARGITGVGSNTP
jgi:hypothetical protein